MFVLGHLGIGSKLASPWSRGLSYRLVLAGTVLPDLIDKPLYYGWVMTFGKGASPFDLLTCTRTFGHTGLFLLALTAASYVRQSRRLAAIAIGVASHLVLDNLADRLSLQPGEPSSALIALTFPAMGFAFGTFPFRGPFDHLESALKPMTLLTEGLGAACLAWDEWKRRHLSEIVRDLRSSFKLFRRASKNPRPREDHF